MIIEFHRDFLKQYDRLRKGEKARTDKTLVLFERNPFDKTLKNHALKGLLKGKRAIWAGGDLRLVLKEEGDYALVLFLEVGSHNQVY